MERYATTPSMDGSNEIEELRIRLKAAHELNQLQEKNFSTLIKDLEHRLGQAITSRDELLKLRQQESLRQQQLIYHLQTALQQSKQTLEQRDHEISQCKGQLEDINNKHFKTQMVLINIHKLLRNEEIEPGIETASGQTSLVDNELLEKYLCKQILERFRQDEKTIAALKDDRLKFEEKMKALQHASELDKTTLVHEYDNKCQKMESDHARSLDIAAERTLMERNRNAKLLLEIEVVRKEHEKCINEKELTIASMEESIASLRTELEHTMKQEEFQSDNLTSRNEESQGDLTAMRVENEELRRKLHESTKIQRSMEERVQSLEIEIKDRTLNLENMKEMHEQQMQEYVREISQLKDDAKKVDENMKVLIKQHQENLEEHQKEMLALQDELSQKANETVKYVEERKNLMEKLETVETEKSVFLEERANISRECDILKEEIMSAKNQRHDLSSIVRGNVDDLNRARRVIEDLQGKLVERERSLRVFNEHEVNMGGVLHQKELTGASLLQERKQIVAFLEEKVRENEQLKKNCDSLTEKLESNVHVLTKMEDTCLALKRKLEVRSKELDVIMEDRNKAVKNLENKAMECNKTKDERDSLMVLMNGKQNEKDQEIAKLLSCLKDSQRELALTKKVLEAKKEANHKAVKMASVTQEEITVKRKEIDALNDRVKWLKESLQATAEEKVYFETKASDLASELRDAAMENKNIRMEFDQMLKYYYSSNEQINDMEKALEKAAVKFSESQALVEKLEQDMAKIKLHYSLEVKELEMKVKSIEGKSEHVQVVKPFHYHDDAVGKESPRNRVKDLEAPPKEHDVSNSKVQQRLLEEVEMTTGFRVLLDDLRGLMSHIKDFSVLIKERKDAVTMATVTRTAEFDDEESDANGGKHAKKMNQSKNDLKTAKRNSKIHRKSLKSESETTSTFDVEKISRTSHEHTKNKSKRATIIRTPLHSSSPKGDGFESIEDITDVTDENGTNRDESDVRSVESRIEEVRTTGKRKSSKSKLPKNSFDMRSHIHPEDVETLLMPPEAQARSHGRAKEILDRLTLKGHELTHGNKKLAELISRQDDGIKKCWGAKTPF